MAGTYTFTVTATDLYGCGVSITYTLLVSAFDLTFYDDQSRSMVCANSLTGAWTWTVLTGVGAGTYSGSAKLTNQGGTLYFVSLPGSPYTLSIKYYALYHRASGSFSYPVRRVNSVLADTNTLNNPPGC